MRTSAATGWPLEVMIKSSLPTDFHHWLAGFLLSSLTEIVLTVPVYRKCATRARREATQSASAAVLGERSMRAEVDRGMQKAEIGNQQAERGTFKG